MSQEKKGKDKELTFEEALAKMDEIASKLSSGNLGIDESVALYEEGVRLAALCDSKIKEARQKITLLGDIKNG